MKLTSTIRILEHGTSSGARPAELVISGLGDEIECREAELLLLNNYATPDTKEAGQPAHNSAMDAIALCKEMAVDLRSNGFVNFDIHGNWGPRVEKIAQLHQ